MKKLSIIIVTYNSENDIYDCLEAIFCHNDLSTEELEIIVVDNNSQETDKMFKQIHHLYGESVITIKNTQNGGYGQGNNVGIRHASAPIILIMNPDVRLVTPSFQEVLNKFEESPKLSMVGMKQLLDDSSASKNSFNCSNMMNGYLGTLLTGICNRQDLYIPCCMYFSGSCFYIRKSMFETIGLFDESIFMYGEENDIHHRMKAKFGAHFLYNKNLQYKHLTMERKQNEATEDKMLKAIIKVCEKFGYSKEKIIRNKIQNTNILLWREIAKKLFSRKYSQERINFLKTYKKHLIEMYKA